MTPTFWPTCTACHHPIGLHVCVEKHGFSWPCTVAGCACEEMTFRASATDTVAQETE